MEGRRERRTITRLALALLAVALALYAQSRIREPNQLELSLALYGVAAVVFVAALRQRREPPLAPPAEADGGPARWRPIGWALVALSLLACALGLYSFREPRPQNLAWWCYLASMPLLLLGLWLGQSTLKLPKLTWRLGLRLEHLLVVALVLFAFALRFYRIAEQPLGVWYDEADNGLWARLMMQDATYRPVYVESTNLPAHFLYLVVASFRLFGEGIVALRLVTALFGTLTVWATYLLARELYGVRMGLAAGFIMAVAHWDVNFSRLAMHGISTPFFIVMVAYWLVRGLRSGRYVHFGLAGVALGLSLCFYVPNRLYPFVLVFLFAHLLITQRGFFRRYYRQALLLVLAALIAFAPVALFIVKWPNVFFARTKTTSIFKDKTPQEALVALRQNAVKHLLMFNYRGDGNGRHNLPGEPMLDFVTSVFFVLGLAYCLYRWRDPWCAFLLVGFAAMLSGGVFSLDFEAPQSLRAIGTLAFAHLIAFAALARLWQEYDYAFGPRWRGYAWVALVPLLAYIGYTNIDIYFNQQAKDFAVWNAYSTPETFVARRMLELGPDKDFRVISLYFQTPTLRFLAPEIGAYKRLETTDSMPLFDTGDREVVLFIDAERRALYEEVRRYYPGGQYEEIQPDFGGPVVLYVCRLTPAQVRGIQGLAGTYYRGETWDGEVLQQRQDQQVAFDWSGGTPIPTPFSVEWRGTLRAPKYGDYRISLRAPAAVELYLDETLVLDAAGEAQLTLAEGNHALRLRAVGAPGMLDLYWSPPGASPQIIGEGALYTNPPVTNNGLLGRYYPNLEWRGEPALAKIDPSLALYFHILLLPRPYTAEWVGKVNIPTPGNYAFGVESIDDSWVYVDERLVAETHVGNQYNQGHITLTAGLHDIRVRFVDKSNWSHINLYWQPPNQPRAIIPAEALFPPQGSYPQLVEAARPPSGVATEQGLAELDPVATWGQQGSGPAQFNEPRDVAVDARGQIYVADTGNRRVQVLDSAGQFLREWNRADQPLVEPLALAVSAAGEVLVLDSDPGWIYRFSVEGNYLGKFGGPEAQLYHPRGMSLAADGTVTVVDTGGGRLIQFDASGAKSGGYGSVGNAPGEFLEPTDVTTDAWGDLYVVDTGNRRIQNLDVFGRYKREWAIPLANAYNGPHLALAKDGSLFATAPELGLIQRYASDGTLLGQWGDGLLHVPVNLTIQDDLLYVADTLNHRVQVFRIRELN